MAESIYNDVLDFDLGTELDVLRNDKNQLEAKVRMLENDIQNLMKAVTDINRTKNLLVEQISSLYNTAKREIERKDRIIKELRREKDDILFRRVGIKQIKENVELEVVNAEKRNQKPDLPQQNNDNERIKRRRSRSKSADRFDVKKSRQLNDRKQFQTRSRSRERYKLSDDHKSHHSRSKSRERDRTGDRLSERERDSSRDRQRGSFYHKGRSSDNYRNRFSDRYNAKDRHDVPHNNYRDEMRDRERDRRWQEVQAQREPELNLKKSQHLFPTLPLKENGSATSTDIEDGEIPDASPVLNGVDANRVAETKVRETESKPQENKVEPERINNEICNVKDSGSSETRNNESKVPRFDIKTYKIPKKPGDEEPAKNKPNENRKERSTENIKYTQKIPRSKDEFSKNRSKNDDSVSFADKTIKDVLETVPKHTQEKKESKSRGGNDDKTAAGEYRPSRSRSRGKQEDNIDNLESKSRRSRSRGKCEDKIDTGENKSRRSRSRGKHEDNIENLESKSRRSRSRGKREDKIYPGESKSRRSRSRGKHEDKIDAGENKPRRSRSRDKNKDKIDAGDMKLKSSRSRDKIGTVDNKSRSKNEDKVGTVESKSSKNGDKIEAIVQKIDKPLYDSKMEKKSKPSETKSSKSKNKDGHKSTGTTENMVEKASTEGSAASNVEPNKIVSNDNGPPTFKNILGNGTTSNILENKSEESQLQLTHDGEIPVLHIEEMSFSNASVLGIGEKHLYSMYLNDTAKLQTTTADGAATDHLSFSDCLKDVASKEASESKKTEEASPSSSVQSNMPDLTINSSVNSSLVSLSSTSTPSVSRVPVRKRRRRAVMMMDD